MFKKLRIKFIAITMAMVAVTMALAFSAVCISEYQRSSTVVQTALSDAVDAAISDSNHDRRFKLDDAQEPPEKPEEGDDSFEKGAGTQAQSQAASKATQAQASFPYPTIDAQPAGLLGSGEEGGIEQAYALDAQENEQQAQPRQNPGQGQAGQPGQGSSPDQPGYGDYGRDAQQAGERPGDGAAFPETTGWDESIAFQPQAQEADAQEQPEDAQSSSQPSAGSGAVWGGQDGEAGAGEAQDDSQSTEITLDSDDVGSAAPPVIGNRGGSRTSSSLVPVAVYAVSENGTLRMIPQVTSASISEDVLKQAAERALHADDGYGTYDDLDLNVLKREDGGTTYLAFADTSYTKSWMNLAVMLGIAGLATMALFFVVCLFYSRWALKPVREAWDSQRQFVADASHDLKTPLTVILANASILLKHPDHTIASESQWVESTQKEAEDMQGLVNEMLELAQIEAGQKLEVERCDLDFSDLVDGETLLFDSVALERSCSFNCAIDEGVHILGNEKQVKKMVSTLVENAFKYVDDGGTIDVTLEAGLRDARLSIRNTGSVIGAEDLPHIFDRFYRTDKARTSGAGGFGLGLAIAHEIAVQHGGDITCSSSEDEGTTFIVQLPVGK